MSNWYYESDGGYPASFHTHYLTNSDNERENYNSKEEALEALRKKNIEMVTRDGCPMTNNKTKLK